MKRVEVKKLAIGSVLKSAIYFYFIPIILMIFGLIVVTIILIAQDEAPGYVIIPAFLIGIVFYTGLYAGIIALVTLCYNWLAGKFGGLIVTIKDVDTEE
ncbi:hypothetical protein [Alkalicoccobacillus murimartini]|uniref:Positive regulator of sigma E activity n=1 Tax=Alkalicoccobacillus murimartini TaxID=171685 RepID=A0ABT9YEZ0_9BACI|nr:hypothetical protein [Alkalicoccobacillus murimartini]MDQ0206070.1 positive regulator of sigma E activity [Alkalicoccobacillus murimartini]